MGWIHDHAPEFNAIGTVFMNCATFAIIYFNVNQLRLNSRSLNVDINFKVFDLRKKLYKDMQLFVKGLGSDKGLRQHLMEREDGEYDCSPEFISLKEAVDNYKYLFSENFAVKLELFILKIEKGIDIEHKVSRLKNKDSSTWTTSDQEEIHKLGDKSKEIINSVSNFELEVFLPYLNLSNFHTNLMEDDATLKNATKSRTIINFFKMLKTFVVSIFETLFKKEASNKPMIG